FFTRLAALHTRHAAALAAGAPPAEPAPGLDALYAEYGLRHAPAATEPDAEAAETIELAGADGQTVTLTGARAVEFLRRADALSVRYSEAHDMVGGNRTAAIAAVEAEFRALYAEYGASFGAEPAAGDGNSVRSEQAAASLWDDSRVGDQYADLGEVSPQPQGNYDDAMTGGSPPPARPADNAETKMSDEFAGIIGLARSIGAEVSELPDADAAAFKTRLAAILAQRDPADAAGQARLGAQASAVFAEYGLAALALAERTPEVERATEFFTRLAALHTRHAAALAAGAPPAEPAPGLDALYAEYGLRHAPAADAADQAATETLEFVGADGQTVTLSGDRAAEFLRRADALSERYATATDAAPSSARDASLAAIEAEYAALLAEYGIAEPPPAAASAPAEGSIEFTRADGQVVKLSGDRADEFLRRSDSIGTRYSEAYSSPASAQRTAALEALEAEHDALLAEFGLGPATSGKGGGAAPAGEGDEPATGASAPPGAAPPGGAPAAGASPPGGSSA
ncbi:MAG: hypothetical protein OXU37_00005, partial [Thaumarchaeota archaeon]|nr:hypothetical protein [Nitrososphaerota archaeon]